MDRSSRARHGTDRRVDVIDRATGRERLADFDDLACLQAVGLDFLRRNPHADDHPAADIGTDRGQAFGQEAHAVLATSPIAVFADVRLRAEELGEEQAMAGDELDAVQPGLGKAAGGSAAGLDDLLDQFQRHRPRHRVEAIIGHGRWCESDVAQSSPQSLRDAAGMGKLAEDLRAVSVDGRREAAITGDAAVMADVQLIGGIAQRGFVEASRFDDDQTRPAFRARLVIADEIVIRGTVSSKVGLVPCR
jgi:hypothetical protein